MFLSSLLLSTLAFATAGAEASSPGLTLEQALEEAATRNPDLRARRTEVEQAEARLLAARTYPFNPVLTLEAAHRDSAESSTDHEARLLQEIEIGGQRQRRATQASAALDAARSQLLRDEQLLAAGVRVAFVEALRGRELLAVERANTDLARSLAEVARKRFDAGAIAQMEVNLAQVQVGRAERDLHLAEGAQAVARSLLAEVVGLDPAEPPEIQGQLDLPVRDLPALSQLIAGALERRADLRAFRETAEATRARIDLARREAVPNLTVGAFYGREEGTDRLTGGEVGIGIPLFNRNHGAISEARAVHRQVLADTEARERQVRQEVAAALARHGAALAATASLQQQVLGTLHENLGLLQRSFESGKIDWTEVLVFRREFVDIQRDYVETLTEVQLAAIELDLAAGDAVPISHEEAQP